jgi:hypothetical protein
VGSGGIGFAAPKLMEATARIENRNSERKIADNVFFPFILKSLSSS